jgi:hypothetical protein
MLYTVQVATRVQAIRGRQTRAMRKTPFHPFVLMTTLLVARDVAVAQPVPELDFVTVGAAGNRGTLPSERPTAFDADLALGAVGYEFRITRTEVLAEQWWEFLEAYRPYYTGSPTDSRFTSTWIGRDIASDAYRRPVEWADFPVDTTWEYAARYCNWLHNNKRSEQWAFESGAYDTSTFTFNADGTGNHQATRSAGARFWIPSYDEMIKAFYYDPDRYGPDQGGYWQYSNRSNSAFVTGLPAEGGTTNAGLGFPYYAAGQYPDAQSPWGLLDTSGGMSEWSETGVVGDGARRFGFGSNVLISEDLVAQTDDISFGSTTSPAHTVSLGFRVATVPSTGTYALSITVFVVYARRKR